MERVVTIKYQTADGRIFDNAEDAAEHEWNQERKAERAKTRDAIWKTAGGLWSVPCQNCGKRTVREFSDDYVWCNSCQYWCYDNGGHTPDDDAPDICFVCGGLVREIYGPIE